MMTMTQWWAPTTVRVSGDSTMRGQLVKTSDGGVICDFPERLFLIANHQIYTDWLYLWWIGYSAGMHGRIYIVLKESLKKIPVIGWGMQFAQFIFLKRRWEDDKPGLARHMQRLNKPNEPMWLMMFPEGTNLASCTREKSGKWAEKNGIRDMKHGLLPRSTGMHFMLQELRQTVDYVYDCTIAYEGVPHGTFAQDIFTVGASYLGGRPPKSVNMYWRRFRVNTIPLDDPKKFELWLRLRWREKDKFIDQYLRTGRFPADTGSSKNHKDEFIHGAGHIESEIKPKYWYEFLQVFAPMGLFALVLYLFYGALPQEVVKKIKSIDQNTVMRQIEAIQKGEFKVPETSDLVATAPQHLQDKFTAVQKFAASQNTSTERIIAEGKKALPAGALPAGDPGPTPKPTTKAPVKPLPVNKPAKTSKVLPQSSKKTLPKQLGNSSPTKTSTAATKKPGQTLGTLLGKETSEKETNENLKSVSADRKISLKPTPKKKVAEKPRVVTAVKKPGLVKPASTVSKKTKALKAAPASKKQSAPAGVASSHQDNGSVDKDAVRHAIKKEVRQGKQEPKRKIRRALEASAGNDEKP